MVSGQASRREPPVAPSASASTRSGQASAASYHAFEQTVAERIRAFEYKTAQQNAVERVQVGSEVSQLRTEVQAAMAAANRYVGESREETRATLNRLEAQAEEAIRSVQIQGSGVIASTEAWAQTQEQNAQEAVRQLLVASATEARAAASSSADAGTSSAAGASQRVDASLLQMNQLFEAERAQQKSEWERERSELVRLVELQRAAAARSREEAERKAGADAAAARDAHAAEIHRVVREASAREARLMAEAREALQNQSQRSSNLERDGTARRDR